MKYLAILLILLAVGLLYIRYAPSDAVKWHGDPLTAPAATQGGWLVRPRGGNAPAQIVAAGPVRLLAAVDAVALAEPRTLRLAGGVNEGRITYVTRSKWMGFPDYTTVTAVPAAGGAVLAIHARQRFGTQDMGVNRARVERWLDAVDARLATAP